MLHKINFATPSQWWVIDMSDGPLPSLCRTAEVSVSEVSSSADLDHLAETAAPQAQCRNCRWWKKLGRQWGRCESKRIGQYIEAEGPLVTRDTFHCRLYALMAVRTSTSNGRPTSTRENTDTCGSQSPAKLGQLMK